MIIYSCVHISLPKDSHARFSQVDIFLCGHSIVTCDLFRLSAPNGVTSISKLDNETLHRRCEHFSKCDRGIQGRREVCRGSNLFRSGSAWPSPSMLRTSLLRPRRTKQPIANPLFKTVSANSLLQKPPTRMYAITKLCHLQQSLTKRTRPVRNIFLAKPSSPSAMPPKRVQAGGRSNAAEAAVYGRSAVSSLTSAENRGVVSAIGLFAVRLSSAHFLERPGVLKKGVI